VCGRYTLTAPPARVAEHFALAGADGPRAHFNLAGLRPRFNIAPGQDVPAVLAQAGERALVALRWGLVPAFAEAASFGARTINARIESAAERPAFRAAFRRRRCLLPADGFYEWRARSGGAEPHHVALPGRALFAFAGLHESWEGEGGTLRSVAILTRAARGRLRELHDRMPAIVAPEDYDAWLDPAPVEPEAVRALLASRVSDALEFRAVDARVNDVRCDEPGCLAPAAQLSLL
jgi:putative SOS response-associated peptidase YedK